jgi:hypothetical protein
VPTDSQRKAAERAGLVRPDGSDADRLALVLEPEAAAVAALSSMEPSEAARVVPGSKIMILDCGGEFGGSACVQNL